MNLRRLGQVCSSFLISITVGCSGGTVDPIVDPGGDPGPSTPPPATNLNFLPGQWHVDALRFAEDGSADTLSGRSTIAQSLSGRATKEVMTIGLEDGAIVSMETLIAQRASTTLWVIARGDATRGTFDVLEGGFAAGSGTFTSPEDSRPDGGLTRPRFSEATSNDFVVDVEHSANGGGNWQREWSFTYKRGGGTLPTGTAVNVCDTAEHHQFDFWLGNWNAFGTNGALNGTSSIKSRLGGCIVEENWVQNPSGTSFNMYDARSELWYQVWIDASGGLFVAQGVRQGDQLSLTGSYGGPRLRVTWTSLDGGHVRQLGESETGGGWVTSYDLTYRPR